MEFYQAGRWNSGSSMLQHRISPAGRIVAAKTLTCAPMLKRHVLSALTWHGLGNGGSCASMNA